MLLLYFLVKNYWSRFHWHHKNRPCSGGRAGERRACWDQRGQTRERGPQSSTYPKSESVAVCTGWSTKPKNTTQNSQNSFYSIHKLLNMISLQSESWMRAPKPQHGRMGDAAHTWVDLWCDGSQQVEEDEQEEVNVPRVLHPRHVHRDRLPIWKARWTQQVTQVCDTQFDIQV